MNITFRIVYFHLIAVIVVKKQRKRQKFAVAATDCTIRVLYVSTRLLSKLSCRMNSAPQNGTFIYKFHTVNKIVTCNDEHRAFLYMLLILHPKPDVSKIRIFFWQIC